MSASIQKRYPYIENLNSENFWGQYSAFLHCGHVHDPLVLMYHWLSLLSLLAFHCACLDQPLSHLTSSP